jgi:starch-binding outer membrane protein, SusD/RagB family
MTNFQTRARLTAAGVLASLLVAGCDVKQELLAPQQPSTLTPADVASAGAAGAEALRIGALGGLQAWVGGGNVNQENVSMLSDLLTDEWKSSDTFLERNETDQRRIQSSNGVWASAYQTTQRARGFARDAITVLAKAQPTQPGEQAEMWFILGYTEMNLSQDFCNGVPYSITANGVPTYQAGITNAAGFNLAITHFDSALTLAGGTDSTAARSKQIALIGKAEALVDLGQFAAAAALVPTSAVPTSFSYNETFSQATVSNETWSLNASQSSARYAVGDSFDLTGTIGNALPFASAKDPRVVVSGGTSNNAKTPGIDKATPWVGAMWTVRTQPIVVVSGVDARLIEAEAKLNAADFAGMVTILNALRAAPPSIGPITPAAMTPLAVPATKDAAVRLFFREKAFWQFGRGQRLSDLRRMIRQYGYTQDQVFPTGTFHKGGPYGIDVNAPLPDLEKSNPLFTGCFDRNA